MPTSRVDGSHIDECQICGYPLWVQYYIIKVDSRRLKVCSGCKEVYTSK